MSQLAPSKDVNARMLFIEALSRSKVGIITVGTPNDNWSTLTSTKEKPIGIAVTKTPDGKSRLLAFADPLAFVEHFGNHFDAVIDGEAILTTAKSDLACEGILVNSAIKESAIILDREIIISALQSREKSEDQMRKRWWKFW